MRTFRSERITWAEGSVKSVPLDFLQDRNPDGTRNVVIALMVEGTAQVDTDGATSLTGADFASFLKNLRVQDAQGVRVDLPGTFLRALQLFEWGDNPTVVAEPAAVPNTQNNVIRKYRWFVPFAPPNAKRPWDYAIPVSTLKGRPDAIEITMPSAADMLKTGAGLTIDGGGASSYVVFAYCRPEKDVEMKSRRELKRVVSQSLTDHYIPINGGCLRSLIAYKPAVHATGGTDLTSITDITCDALGLSQIDPAAQLHGYHLESTRQHDNDRTADPFVPLNLGRAWPVVFPLRDQKIATMFRAPGSVLVRTTGNTVADLPWITDILTGRAPATVAEELAHSRGRRPSLKTAGKSARDPDHWGTRAQFMPAKAR